MKTKHSLKMKSVISAVLAIVMILGTLPAMNVFAAQKRAVRRKMAGQIITVDVRTKTVSEVRALSMRKN